MTTIKKTKNNAGVQRTVCRAQMSMADTTAQLWHKSQEWMGTPLTIITDDNPPGWSAVAHPLQEIQDENSQWDEENLQGHDEQEAPCEAQHDAGLLQVLGTQA